MTITTRANKGVSLSFDEMDENFRDLRFDTDIDRVLENGNTTTRNLTVGDLQYTTRNYLPGEIVQKQIIRYDGVQQVSVGTVGVGTSIPELALAITPRFANSLINMQWTIFGEPSNHNVNFRVFLNGSVDNTAGWEGYNNNSGVDPGQYRTVAMFQPYETNYDSTPHQMTLNHMSSVQALGGIATYTWTPAVFHQITNYNIQLNRSINTTTDGNYENGVSFGYIEEIAQ